MTTIILAAFKAAFSHLPSFMVKCAQEVTIMPGKWIKYAQHKLYMSSRVDGDRQITSAAKAGVSERSGRRMEKGEGGPEHRKPRNWRTRKDPLSPIWEERLVPMLEENPKLIAITLYEFLELEYPGKYSDKVRRTLERRVRTWKAQHGPAKEVIFRQTKQPGVVGISDFSKPKESYAVTINGAPFHHMLFHFRLPFSGWAGVRVIEGGESFTALSGSMNIILRKLGGTPLEHRTDSLSAAYKNANDVTQEDLTDRYNAFCEHFNMKPTRNNRGVAHENGAIESPHGHLKRRIQQHLILRDSSDFSSIDEFQQWLDKLVDRYNQRCSERLQEERACLQALPDQPGVDYSEISVRVTSQSTANVARTLYSVPSRLIGEKLYIHLYEKTLKIHHNNQYLMDIERVFPAAPNKRSRKIDFRHVIDSLVRKPQAFRNSTLRDDILPDANFKAIWQRVDQTMDAHMACHFIVKLLYIAKDGQVDEIGDWVHSQTTLPTIEVVRKKFKSVPSSDVSVASEQGDLGAYDVLLNGGAL